ncbi:glycosyltransferase family 9 protein [Telmatospirillum siberiense]|uniref:Glycosyltransferase family 9 protein n=1 Tax=Telmatospirillum siberiense TaxID=382514 RepID=A0A2N3PVP6_9PROT|nr:glycosyltransferase family 9 protein [Telmatospirillum siberiense]PKU24458.1 glycosyltransferase family 9 protein [Telmatospirillum siberiense]
MPRRQISRVLIYRLGSIGDFVVSLPCLHLIRRQFPTQRIGLLTIRPVVNKAAPARTVLDGSGLVDDYISYQMGTRNLAELYRISRLIRSFKADLLVYLVSRPASSLVVRDYVFFRLSGVRRIVGLPWSSGLRSNLPQGDDLWESEAQRLARCLSPLGDAGTQLPENWDLHLSAAEIAAADALLQESFPGAADGRRWLGVSVGTKQAIKDWGDDNWRAVLDGLGDPHLGLVVIGAAEERARSEEVVQGWPGPVVNACGRLSPRQSAALIRRTALFLCHDSGPMHLAAAVGTRCIAIFSKWNRPGEWFPFGGNHKIFYPPPGAESIHDIYPDEVISVARDILGEIRIPLEY